MSEQKRTAIIISVSSDIGTAMFHRWRAKGWRVGGTYRTRSPALEAMEAQGLHAVYCDLANKQTMVDAISELEKECSEWDVLVLAPGSQEPIGAFAECDFDAWESGVLVNFVSQLRMVHGLLACRRRVDSELDPIVLFFAGGATNRATVNYSAYTISKIALIKMTELLDAEIPNARFAIVGPGWVKTKIHTATLNAGAGQAGTNYQQTINKLSSDECTPVEIVRMLAK